VNLVREYLHDNYAENVSLEDLARRANLSPYRLNRIFSREVGLPRTGTRSGSGYSGRAR
jgi:AraC-like DNA-binding protein